MKFRDTPATKFVTVLAQDPTIKDWDGAPLFTKVEIPHERVNIGPKGSRIHVIDYDTSTDKYIAPRGHDQPFDMVADLKTQIEAQTLARFPDKTSDAFNAAYTTAFKAGALTLVDDPHFHAQNVYTLTAATLLTFERALGRHISWGFDYGSHQIKVAPHGFQDMNAFYSREDEMLAFGYFLKSPDSDEFAFTCLSYDVVVHEATHALLDGLRTEYMRPSSVDQGALHEAIADIVALLSVFNSEELVNRALGGQKSHRTISKSAFTPEALKATFLSGLAEQFGAALNAHGFSGFRGDALRRSAEIEPDPNLYETARVDAEVHDFDEILVAAVFNAFLHIWEARVEPLHVVQTQPDSEAAESNPALVGRVDRERAVEEGAKAAKHLLHMCIRALDYLPPVHVEFGDYLSAILTADWETVLDDNKYKYRDVLKQSFASYGIKPPTDDGFWNSPEEDTRPRDGTELVYGFSGHAEMQWDRESVFRFIWENSAYLRLNDEAFTKVVSVRPVVRHGPDGAIIHETVVEYLQLLDIMAKDLHTLGIDKPSEMPDYQWVQLQGGGTLIFNDYGKLKFDIGTKIISSAQSEHLNNLWRFGFFQTPKGRDQSFAELHKSRALKSARRPSKEQW